MKKSIALITGGENSEKEISLKSVQTFLDTINTDKYTITLFYFPQDKNSFLQQISHFDIVIPVIHGIGGEDGEITALCEQYNIQYFFTDSKSHALCIDKYICGEHVRAGGYSVPMSRVIQQGYNDLPSYTGKVFIKPVHGGSSIDSGVFNSIEAGRNLINTILLYDHALIQECVSGQEFTVSIDGDRDKTPQVLAISEIITGQAFFDYEAKYSLKNTHEVTPANISTTLQEKIEKISMGIYKHCNIKCLGRIDFIYSKDNDILYFLEINTIPGFTATSFFPQAILHSGLAIKEYVDKKIASILHK